MAAPAVRRRSARAAARTRACGRCRGVVGSQPWSAVRISRSRAGSRRSSQPPTAASIAFSAPWKPGDVVAVAVDLVGLDEVGEDEAAVEARRSARPSPASAAAFVGPLCCDVDADAVEHLRRSCRRCAPARPPPAAPPCRSAPGGGEREVLAAVGALERARLAAERPRDHAPDGVLAGHDLARRGADRVQLGRRHLVDVGGDLQHRVGRRVDDQVAGRAGAARRSRRSPPCRCRGGCRGRRGRSRRAAARSTSSGKPSG